MSGRELRKLLKTGEWVKQYTRPPSPPEEWGDHRRTRMSVAIACAFMFLVRDKELKAIAEHFSKKGMMGEVTPQRVSQYVEKAIPFLIDRGMFAPAQK